MRILHTSDWHLGASLEGISRDEDHARFLAWLADTVEARAVQVLVVAGDVFDQSHPSAEAQRLYYAFLRDLARRATALRRVVVVGGNHDSAARLDAPAEVLDALSVHVVGGLLADPATWDRCVCPISLDGDAVEAVVLAVPFVHEFRLGVRTAAVPSSEIAQAFRRAFTGLYRDLCDRGEARGNGAPLLATGHLACLGADRADAPEDIHLIGSIGGLPVDVLDPRLRYVALGHIHKSYRVGETQAYYSGSPVALSFREARLPRSVRLVELTGDATTVDTLEVPTPRRLVELRGSSAEVEDALRTLAWAEDLPPIVSARVRVERFSLGVDVALRKVLQAHGARAPLLVDVKQETRHESTPRGKGERSPPLRELSPEDVFRRLCRDRGEEPDDALLEAFRVALAEPER